MEAQNRVDIPKIDTATIGKVEWDNLACTIVNAAVRFFENPENISGFNDWKTKKDIIKEANHDRSKSQHRGTGAV